MKVEPLVSEDMTSDLIRFADPYPKQIPKQKRCRNRRPQANKTLKTTSPSTLLEKIIPKRKSIKSPSKHRKSYVPKHWLITPQANPKQTPSKPQGIRPKGIPFLKPKIRNIGKSGNNVMMN